MPPKAMAARKNSEDDLHDALIRAVTPRVNRFMKHLPIHPDPAKCNPRQAAFLLLQCREALYGGAAGGGKTAAILMAALQYVDVPGYSALILRRTYPMLKQGDGLLPRAMEWLMGTGAVGSEMQDGLYTRWTFPSGATLAFGHMQHEADKYNYQGGAYQFIGFDELTQFTRTQYLYMLSRLRRLEGSPIPLRMRATSNPGGEGHAWVRDRFIPRWYLEGKPSGPPKWSQPDEDGVREPIIFIPARVDDNPFLDRSEYVKSLAELDPITRAQLLRGDWNAVNIGSKFPRTKARFVKQRPTGGRLVRYWDFAATEPKPGEDPDYTVGLLGHFDAGVFTICDVRRARLSPRETDDLVRVTAQLDGRNVPVWIEQEPGASGKKVIDHYQRIVLPGYEVRGNRVTGDKELRANPLSSAWDAGNVQLVEADWNADFIDELEAFPKGTHDDQVDAASGAYEKLTEDIDATEVEVVDLHTSNYWGGA